MQDVLRRLKGVLVKCLGENDIDDSMLLRANLGMQSIDILEFVFLLQEEFDLDLDPDMIMGDVKRLDNDISVEDLAEYIHCRLTIPV